MVSIERSSEQVRYLRANRERFEAYNLRIVEGEAPEVLAAETPPAAVFLGGSGGRLDAILTLCFDRIAVGGCLVANFVGLENLSLCLERLRGASWKYEVTQIQLNHGQALAGLTMLSPERPVWIMRGSRDKEALTGPR